MAKKWPDEVELMGVDFKNAGPGTSGMWTYVSEKPACKLVFWQDTDIMRVNLFMDGHHFVQGSDPTHTVEEALESLAWSLAAVHEQLDVWVG